jgi:DNA invertase Pin-like site-specific DNA recombinase
LKIGLEGIDPALLTEIDDPAVLKEIGAIDPAPACRAPASQRGQRVGRPRTLTETHIAFARRMLAQGATRKTIASTLKVPYSTLCVALKPYAAEGPPRPKPPVPPRALTETHIALARRMLAQGATRKTIAQTLKVSPMTLYIALKPYSAGPFPQMGPKPKITAEQRKEIIEAVSSGRKTGAEIARLFKIHPVTVSRIVSQARVRT